MQYKYTNIVNKCFDIAFSRCNPPWAHKASVVLFLYNYIVEAICFNFSCSQNQVVTSSVNDKDELPDIMHQTNIQPNPITFHLDRLTVRSKCISYMYIF